MNSEEISKLEKADQVMFAVNQSDNIADQLNIVREILNDVNIISGDASNSEVLEKYNQNVLQKIRQIIQNSKHANPIPDFNQTTLKYFLDSSDSMEKNLAQNCRRDFKNYAQIVLRFGDLRSAWRKEKNADDYRNAFMKLDSDRTMIHNNCLNDIEILNRLAKQSDLEPFAVITSDMNRTNIGNGILEQYYKDLLLHEKEAFE